MGTYTSGEDLFVKMRKPYTITKQRERWTEDEHNRFLDALKLYGRAWQRIEEHIGTKTAVQIRSHAQKFFSKLEKEAHAGGVLLRQTLDIEIPPPRPKRKPSNPYPRKSSASSTIDSSIVSKDGKSLNSALSLQQGEQVLQMKNSLHPEKHAGNEKSAEADDPPEDDNCSEVLSFLKEPPSATMSSASKSSFPKPSVLKDSCSVRESMPLIEIMNDKGTKDESHPRMETKENLKSAGIEAHYADLALGTTKTPELENCYKSRERPSSGKQADELHHVPGHSVGGNSETCVTNQSPNAYPSSIIYQGGSNGNLNLFTNHSTDQQSNSSMSCGNQSSPDLAPSFVPYVHNQDFYSSLLNISSTFPSLIISALLQNPAAHLAASLSASVWSCANAESAESSAGNLGGFPFRHMSPSANLAALAAATIAAASAWWTTHGLLPIYPPLHSTFAACPTAPMTVPSMDAKQGSVGCGGKEMKPHDPPLVGQPLELEQSVSLKPQHSASKLRTSRSSDSEESGVRRSNSNQLSPVGREEEPAPVPGHGDSNKAKTRKKVDRSSCGSNTPSSSEVETDALEKYEKGSPEPKEPDASNLSSELNNRRNRTPSYSNESWKEVSEEGRLAFQALFSREVLPQSFSPPHDLKDKELHKISVDVKQLLMEYHVQQSDLNGKTCEASPDYPSLEKSDLSSSKCSESGLRTIGLGPGKLRSRCTGFKPYKRCSMEVKESIIANGDSQVEESDSKRIRLEEKALT
ncbi:hypothetical protein Sjap_005782 [Stephania japonica]|uniref:LHY n=1 Tax=Stephania japonica TaxID=461633 RepID=A0AAP0K6C6_9MAGN